MKRKNLKRGMGIGLGVLLLGILAFAYTKKVSPLSWGMHASVNTKSGVALQGYDPVAYQADEQAVLGKAQWSYDWQGATWHFASAAHRDLFQANPEQYAPQFGGYCSFAVSKGFTANSNPEVWHVEAGKLYVFDSEDMKTNWLAELQDGVIATCEANWQ